MCQSEEWGGARRWGLVTREEHVSTLPSMVELRILGLPLNTLTLLIGIITLMINTSFQSVPSAYCQKCTNRSQIL